MKDTYLVTYLNDHLAGSVAGIELARRCLSENRGTEFEGFFQELVAGLRQEQAILKQLIARLDASPSTVKMLGGWFIEKAGRLKMNDSFFRYSALSRVIELEALVMGLQAQLRMWSILEAYRSEDPRFVGINFTLSKEHAKGLLEEAARHHLRASAIAFQQQ